MPISKSPSFSEEKATRVAAFLDAHHVMSLATCGPDGPHAANLFYARDGYMLLWVSEPESRHSIELEADSRVAATVAPDYSDFSEICGVQVSGHARRLTVPHEIAHARQVLEARYPFLKLLSEGAAALQDAYGRVQVYRLDPTRIVLIDNSRGFGHKDMLEFEPDAD